MLVARLHMEHLSDILSLQQIVVDQLEQKDILQPLTKEEYAYILQGNGLMLGVFTNDQLIAFRALLFPPIDEDHLGFDIGLSREELEDVIYQEISIVHPKARGNGLQQTLANLIMAELERTNKAYKYICCTVAPFNIPSLKDKFAQGMEIAALKQKYGHRLRYIFVKTRNPMKRTWQEYVSLRIEDMAGQQTLLTSGWRGIALEQRNHEYWIRFGK
ncbi:MAG: GNAT family N-acetyltransferase [Anoxybacillus gonensis]|nr:GNAT family N-acetyltransferase [Anoxybacillus gonensis]